MWKQNCHDLVWADSGITTQTVTHTPRHHHHAPTLSSSSIIPSLLPLLPLLPLSHSLSLSLSLFLSFLLSFSCSLLLSLSLSLTCLLPLSYSLLSFWTRNEGPRTGSRQKQHSTAVRKTVIVYATTTTEQNHRLTQKEASHRNEVTTSGDLAHVDAELPMEAWPPVQPPCILCTHARCMRHILGCGCTRHIHRMRRPRRTW